MSSKGSYQRFFPLLLLAAFSLSYLGQLRFDTDRRYAAQSVNTTYNIYIEPQPLSSASARVASFGATEFLADWYWLKLIQYYGGGDPYGKYRKLAELFNTVTDLSPKFFAPYQSGLLVLPGEGFVSEALFLGEKGQRNLPDRWEIPYYEGLVYHIYKKDYAAAAQQFQIASTKPGAPENTKYFAAIYYNQADQRQTAYQIFQTIYDNTPDEFIRDRTKKYLIHLQGIFYLEDGVKKFQQQFHRHPAALDELVSKKVIEAVPVSPLGLQYTYDSGTGQVGESKR